MLSMPERPWWGASRTSGVRAPLSLALGLEPEPEPVGDAGSDGESDRGVDMELGGLDPAVATTDGEDGGSGDRVKYTTLASEPPT